MEITGKVILHGDALIVSVSTPKESGLRVEMVINDDYVSPHSIVGGTHVGVFSGDTSTVGISFFDRRSAVGHGRYVVQLSGSLLTDTESGVCVGLFEK